MISIPLILPFSAAVLLLYVILPLYLGVTLGGVPGLLSVCVGLLSALFWYGEAPRHALRGIPGPSSKWLIGDIEFFIQKGGYHVAYQEILKTYGRVARVQMGHHPQLVVHEPALIKEICMEQFDKFKDRYSMFTLRNPQSLLVSKGDHWHRSRRALNPAFNSIKLSAFADTITRHCQALSRRLERVRVVSKEEQPVDVLQLYGDLTMDVIGSTSFDAEFGLQECPLKIEEEEEKEQQAKEEKKPTTTKGDSEEKNQRQKDVLGAAKAVFMNSTGIMGAGGPIQKIVTVVLPFLGPIFKILYPLFRGPEGTQFFAAIMTLDRVMGEILEGRSQFSTKSPTASPTKSAGGEEKKEAEEEVASASFVDANFIDLVRKARDPDSGIALSREEVRDQLNLFVLAGYETTANTLAFTSFLLAQNPEVEKKLVAEIQKLAPSKDTQLSFRDLTQFTYTNQVVNEALRLYPPGAVLSREAKQDVTIGGGKYHLKKGTWVVVPVYSLQRDEMFWPNPEQFDPERFAPENADSLTKYAHLPFGLGPRNCIGQRFALEEIKLALISIYRDHTFQLHNKTDLPLKLRAGVTMSAADGIWMTVHRREHESS